MAASRVNSWRLLRRYKYFILCVLIFLSVQFIIGGYMLSSKRNERNTDELGFDVRGIPSLETSAAVLAERPWAPNSLLGSQRAMFLISEQCNVTDGEALIAIGRAKSPECKRQIAAVSCLAREKLLFPSILPRECPLAGDSAAGKHLGCFRDYMNDRAMTGLQITLADTNSPSECINVCLQSGFNYAGLQSGRECWCGDEFGKHKQIPGSDCNLNCPNSSDTCGGNLALDVYETGYGERPNNSPPLADPPAVLDTDSSSDMVRILFMLTLSGRGIRQVTRLLKSIYHVNHYYYIHVDSRQHYLYTELKKLSGRFDNIRLMRRRMSTIWGGASLLTMLLSAMEEALDMRDWQWDFFLNLSESDFPVKSLESLTAFLGQNRKLNFMKSHGHNTPKFMLKQGLDKIFHECDEHLWRIGSRTVPTGIQIDGGSDWVCIQREFASYVTQSNSSLVTGLKEFFHYALLPAESFFHTVIHNSPFCGTFSNNNLHKTNWNRRQGCHCQYKNVVDWCGCSPNDFKVQDMPTIKTLEAQTIFFARKFEAVISNSIFNIVEDMLYGTKLNYDEPSFRSYWQNEFHHADPIASHKGVTEEDSRYTFYQSFARLSTAHIHARCALQYTGEILQVHSYFYDDVFRGFLVQFSGEISSGRTIVLEAYLMPVSMTRVVTPYRDLRRLRDITFGTKFDQKELVFRNWGSLMGPLSEMNVRFDWGLGTASAKANIVFIDPGNDVAGVYDLNTPLTQEEHATHNSPTFTPPLVPGAWTAQVLLDWNVGIASQFLIVPYSHIHQRPVTADEALELNSIGPQAGYNVTSEDVKDQVVSLSEKGNRRGMVEDGARKLGEDLYRHIDSLVGQFWSVKNVCVDVVELSGPCVETLPLCSSTDWSSSSHDPKSKIGPVDPRTGKFTRLPRKDEDNIDQ